MCARMRDCARRCFHAPTDESIALPLCSLQESALAKLARAKQKILIFKKFDNDGVYSAPPCMRQTVTWRARACVPLLAAFD